MIGKLKNIIFDIYRLLSVFLLQYHDRPIYSHFSCNQKKCMFLSGDSKCLKFVLYFVHLFACLLCFILFVILQEPLQSTCLCTDSYRMYSYIIVCAWKSRFDKHTEMKIKNPTHQRKKANLALCISLQENLTSNSPYRHCPFFSASISLFTKSSYVLSENQRLVLLPCYYYCIAYSIDPVYSLLP